MQEEKRLHICWIFYLSSDEADASSPQADKDKILKT